MDVKQSFQPDAGFWRGKRVLVTGHTGFKGAWLTLWLTRMGAHQTLFQWEDRRMRKEVRATANRLANFDDANLRRSAQAAVAACARVERALELRPAADSLQHPAAPAAPA